MLTLSQPANFTLQNKKCGEIFLMSPTIFNVTCCVCHRIIYLEEFAKHFLGQHLQLENKSLLDLEETENNILPADIFVTEEILVKEEQDNQNLIKEENEVESPVKLLVSCENDSEENDDNRCLLELIVEAKAKRKRASNSKKITEPTNKKPKTSTKRSTRSAKSKKGNASEDKPEDDTTRENNLIAPSVNNDKYKELTATDKIEDPLQTKEGEEKTLTSAVTVVNENDFVADNFTDADTENIKNQPFYSSHDEQEGFNDSESDWFPEEKESKQKSVADPKEVLPFPCPICQRAYRTKHSLQKHNYSVHNPNKPPRKRKDSKPKNKCDICNEVFRSAPVLRAHKWKHTGIICDICGITFTKVGHLVQHKIRHTGIKNFKCKECEKEFFTAKELKSHMVCHTQRMAAICEICGKGCRNRAVLKEHMRRHTGERPAKCGVCGKCFFNGHDLNEHAVSHTTARPFKCDICGSTFQRKKALRVHKRIHSNDRRHPCKICGKAFYQSTSLKTHMRVHDAAVAKEKPVGSAETVQMYVDSTGTESAANVVVIGMEAGDIFQSNNVILM